MKRKPRRIAQDRPRPLGVVELFNKGAEEARKAMVANIGRLHVRDHHKNCEALATLDTDDCSCSDR